MKKIKINGFIELLDKVFWITKNFKLINADVEVKLLYHQIVLSLPIIFVLFFGFYSIHLRQNLTDIEWHLIVNLKNFMILTEIEWHSIVNLKNSIIFFKIYEMNFDIHFDFWPSKFNCKSILLYFMLFYFILYSFGSGIKLLLLIFFFYQIALFCYRNKDILEKYQICYLFH